MWLFWRVGMRIETWPNWTLFVGAEDVCFCGAGPKKRCRIWNNFLGSPSRPLDFEMVFFTIISVGIQFQGTNIVFLVLETYQAGEFKLSEPKRQQAGGFIRILVGKWKSGHPVDIKIVFPKKRTTLRKLFRKITWKFRVPKTSLKKWYLWIRGLCWNSLGVSRIQKSTNGRVYDGSLRRPMFPPNAKTPKNFQARNQWWWNKNP